MILIYIEEDNPAGRFWLDYEETDTCIVEHLLNGGHWSPHEEAVRDFIRVAALHGLKLEMPW